MDQDLKAHFTQYLRVQETRMKIRIVMLLKIQLIFPPINVLVNVKWTAGKVLLLILDKNPISKTQYSR